MTEWFCAGATAVGVVAAMVFVVRASNARSARRRNEDDEFTRSARALGLQQHQGPKVRASGPVDGVWVTVGLEIFAGRRRLTKVAVELDPQLRFGWIMNGPLVLGATKRLDALHDQPEVQAAMAALREGVRDIAVRDDAVIVSLEGVHTSQAAMRDAVRRALPLATAVQVARRSLGTKEEKTTSAHLRSVASGAGLGWDEERQAIVGSHSGLDVEVSWSRADDTLMTRSTVSLATAPGDGLILRSIAGSACDRAAFLRHIPRGTELIGGAGAVRGYFSRATGIAPSDWACMRLRGNSLTLYCGGLPPDVAALDAHLEALAALSRAAG